MVETTDRPYAVRAVAFTGPSKWRRRPERRVRYDAYWVDELGFVVEGPLEPEPTPPENVKGRPRLSESARARKDERNKKAFRIWRVGLGVASVSLGEMLVFGTHQRDFFGFLGCIFLLVGLSLLLGLLPRKYQWWLPKWQRQQ